MFYIGDLPVFGNFVERDKENGARSQLHADSSALRQAPEVARTAGSPHLLVWSLDEVTVLQHAAG